MTQDDAENAYRLNLDPDVIKYTGDKSFQSVEEAKEFLLNYKHYEKYGFGRWAVINKDNKEYLGFCGLKYTPELDEHDIGFRLIKKYWNKGYATEASKACIDYGFNKLGINWIVGRAMKENIASVRVLEKSGLAYWKEFDFDGELGVVYKIGRNDQFYKHP